MWLAFVFPSYFFVLFTQSRRRKTWFFPSNLQRQRNGNAFFISIVFFFFLRIAIRTRLQNGSIPFCAEQAEKFQNETFGVESLLGSKWNYYFVVGAGWMGKGGKRMEPCRAGRLAGWTCIWITNHWKSATLLPCSKCIKNGTCHLG